MWRCYGDDVSSGLAWRRCVDHVERLDLETISARERWLGSDFWRICDDWRDCD